MRSYREYYALGLDDHKDWLSKQDDEWWRTNVYHRDKDLTTMGDYLPGTRLLTIDEKNDASLFANHTNVKNSEWSILFHMLGQALVDWCRENGKKDIWMFSLNVKRVVDGLNDCYNPEFTVSIPSDEDGYDTIRDKKELKSWEDCRNVLCDIIWEFMYTHKNDIPNDWNYICFGLDDLDASIKAGEWVCFSDGWMNVCSMHYNEEGYDLYVECM